jgi:hypothetical protein
MQVEQSYGKCNKRGKKEINRFAELVNALVSKTNPLGVESSSLLNGIMEILNFIEIIQLICNLIGWPFSKILFITVLYLILNLFI